MISQGRNAFLFNIMQTIQGSVQAFVKLKPMFKQHMNLMIWNLIFVHLTMASNSFEQQILCKNGVSFEVDISILSPGYLLNATIKICR